MLKTKTTWRPMTEIEKRAALALAPGRVCYPVASSAKGLAGSLEAAAAAAVPKITDRQAEAMWRQIYRFRRQIQDKALIEAAEATQTAQKLREQVQAKLDQVKRDGGQTPAYVLAKPQWDMWRISTPQRQAEMLERWKVHPGAWERMSAPTRIYENGSPRSMFMWQLCMGIPMRLGMPGDGHE